MNAHHHHLGYHPVPAGSGHAGPSTTPAPLGNGASSPGGGAPHPPQQQHLLVMDPSPFDFDAPLRVTSGPSSIKPPPPDDLLGPPPPTSAQEQDDDSPPPPHLLLMHPVHHQQQHHHQDPHHYNRGMPPPHLQQPQQHQQQLQQHHYYSQPPGVMPMAPHPHHHHHQQPPPPHPHHHHPSMLLHGGPEFSPVLSGSSSTEENGSQRDGEGGEGGGVRLWGLDWRRDVTKEGKSTLVTTLMNEGEYERFMKRFDVDDLQEGFYWVTDRGRKYSKATSAVMQRMRWKDTFNCFFGRRHTKRQEAEPAVAASSSSSQQEMEGLEGGGGEGGEEAGTATGGKRRRQRASQKVYCPASLSATCMMDGKVELRYYDRHVEHPVFDGRPKRKRSGGEGGAGQADKTRRTRLIQNEHVSAWRAVIKPNQPPKMHRHDKDRMVYVLKGGRLKVVGENNDVKKVINLEPDKAYWFPKTPPGELQADVNDGPEAIQMVVVEVEATNANRAPQHQQLTGSQAQQAATLLAHHHHHHPPAPVGGY